jgi:hypothetical protein
LSTFVANNLTRSRVYHNNWELDAGFETPRVRSALEAILGGLFIVRAAVPGTNFAVGDFAAFALVLVGIFKSPLVYGKVNRAYATVFSLLMAFLVVESLYNGADFTKRALKLSLLAIVGGFIGSRRFDIVQILKGFGVALLLNVPLYYLHIAPDLYAGCLTGFLMDKNVAGLYYASMSFALMALFKKTSARVALLSIGGVLVFLTLSRTSLVAFGFGIIWLAIAKRAGIVSRIVFAILVSVSYVFLQDRFAHIGVFADRVGSDALRSRIDAAMAAKVAVTPWYGQGLGKATVILGPKVGFFFHNSYLALITEGGWVFLLVVLGGFALITLRFVSAPPFTRSEVYVQSAGVVVMLCATRLGEVFMTLPAFVIVGASLQLLSSDQIRRAAAGVVKKTRNRFEPKAGRIRA